jgi:hypothetical protein
MKIILRIQGAKGSRIQVKGMEVKTLNPSNPGIFESYFPVKPSCPFGASPIMKMGFVEH